MQQTFGQARATQPVGRKLELFSHPVETYNYRNDVVLPVEPRVEPYSVIMETAGLFLPALELVVLVPCGERIREDEITVLRGPIATSYSRWSDTA